MISKIKTFIELEEELKQVENELKKGQEENEIREDKVKSFEKVEQENVELEAELFQRKNDLLDLTHILKHASISRALLTDVKEDEEFLNLNLIPVTRQGDELTQTEQEFTISITKDISIYLLNEYNTLYEEDLDYMVNLERTPFLEIFNDFGGPLFIREADRDIDFIFKGLQMLSRICFVLVLLQISFARAYM